MKFGNLLLVGATAFLSLTASAQDENRECDRMRFLAGEGVKVEDYKTASMYYLKGEVLCGGYDKANWERLVGSLMFAVARDTVESSRKLYVDTLLAAFDRQEAAGFYDQSNDLSRALNMMQATVIDAEKADKLFQRGIEAQGLKTHESYLIYAYYATYSMYLAATGEEQAKLKKRMIADYFRYSDMVNEAGMTPLTQETLTSYLTYVVQDCKALLPEIDGYIKGLPEDKDAAILAIQRMMHLLEDKSCTESKEYEDLNNAWLQRDPNSMDALLISLERKSGSEALPIINEIMEKTTDTELKAKLQYQKALIQFKAGQYTTAYATGRACTGKYKADGLYIASQCVAKTANSCGNSTFERKCNYIYAAQLAEQAGQGGAAATYRGLAPTSSECFNENSPTSVTLTCWGVSVNPCP